MTVHAQKQNTTASVDAQQDISTGTSIDTPKQDKNTGTSIDTPKQDKNIENNFDTQKTEYASPEEVDRVAREILTKYKAAFKALADEDDVQ